MKFRDSDGSTEIVIRTSVVTPSPQDSREGGTGGRSPGGRSRVDVHEPMVFARENSTTGSAYFQG